MEHLTNVNAVNYYCQIFSKEPIQRFLIPTDPTFGRTLMEEPNVFDLPCILAGPIVRRSESSAIHIWICTSKSLNLGVRIYEGRAHVPDLFPQNVYREKYREKTSDAPEQSAFGSLKPTTLPSKLGANILGEGFSQPVQAGVRLFFNLVRATPFNSNGFPQGKEISYEIYVLDSNKKFQNAELLLDFEERAKITLDESPIASPSFELQDSKTADLRAVFGSCRKLHSAASDMTVQLLEKMFPPFDTFLVTPKMGLDRPPLNSIIAKVPLNSASRPTALFLLGDQIYADDVSSLLLPFLHEMSIALLPEILPIDVAESELFSPGKRQQLSNTAQFTSTDAKNHLMEFGEYCAMYIAAFSGKRLPESVEIEERAANLRATLRRLNDKSLKLAKGALMHKKIVRSKSLDGYSSFAQLVPDSDMQSQLLTIQSDIESIEAELTELDKSTNELAYIDDAKRGSESMRRIMANTPTYMLLDDHEITDDFNITPEWEARVGANALGTRIVVNGLAAYWLFQGWGNDPDLSMETHQDPTIQKIATMLQARTTTPIHTADTEVLNYFKVHTPWSYLSATNPPALFLDTRMHRSQTLHRSLHEIELDINEDEIGRYSVKRDIDIPHYGTTPDKYTALMVNQTELDTLFNKFSVLLANSDTLIVCTPQPIFGAKTLDEIKTGTALISGKTKTLVTALVKNEKMMDRKAFMDKEQEDWGMNPYSVVSFMSFIARLFNDKQNGMKGLWVLSGDVHYSFEKRIFAKIWKGNGQPISLQINQITSSAAKNQPVLYPFSGTPQDNTILWMGKYEENFIDLANSSNVDLIRGSMPNSLGLIAHYDQRETADLKYHFISSAEYVPFKQAISISVLPLPRIPYLLPTIPAYIWVNGSYGYVNFRDQTKSGFVL